MSIVDRGLCLALLRWRGLLFMCTKPIKHSGPHVDVDGTEWHQERGMVR